MTKDSRDAFGRLLVDPAELSLPDRVDCVRRVAGELLAGHTRESQWLGRALLTWLRDGDDFARLLGVKAERGSHRTAQRLAQQQARAHALVRLSRALGSDLAASAVLRGSMPCPTRCADLFAQAKAMRCPSSRYAFVRARSLLAVAPHRR